MAGTWTRMRNYRFTGWSAPYLFVSRLEFSRIFWCLFWEIKMMSVNDDIFEDLWSIDPGRVERILGWIVNRSNLADIVLRSSRIAIGLIHHLNSMGRGLWHKVRFWLFEELPRVARAENRLLQLLKTYSRKVLRRRRWLWNGPRRRTSRRSGRPPRDWW